MVKKSKNIISFLAKLFFIVLLVQLCITYFYTNTKRFSTTSLIRNVTFVLFIYLFIKTNKIFYLLLPFLIEIIMNILRYYSYTLDKYIATEYMYSDYFRELNKRNPIYSDLTEGIYDNMFGIELSDHSPDNLKKVLTWTKDIYDNSYKNKTQSLRGTNGKIYDDANKLKHIGDNNKFKTICDICKVHKDMKILEIGFGEGDFLNYLKDNYGVKAVGVSISEEQVKLVKSRGFEAYHMNMWDITDKFGTFDLVIQCGNVEYTKSSSESENKYSDYFKIIQKILNKNGNYFITCVHMSDTAYNNFTMYDWFRCYFLLFGNDGSYPIGRFSLTKQAEKAKLKNIFQIEKTNEYYLTSIFFLSTYGFTNKHNNHFTYSGLFDSIIKTIADPYYIHTYLCMTPTKDFNWCPWLWQFIPCQRGNWFGQFATLQYILFQNME
jgi:cyclopropane fatty-acyl-phospholipid synthase-like methyltransferase